MGFIRDIFSSPEAPPATDYADVGRQQTEANIKAAEAAGRLARTDLLTPYSTTTYDEIAPNRYMALQTLRPEYEALRGQEAGFQRDVGGLSATRLGQVPTDAFTLGETDYALPSFGDLNTFTTGASDEFFNRAAARLNPQFDIAESNLRSQLAANGIPPGTAAFEREIEEFRQAKNDTLADLSSQAVFQGQNLGRETLANILTGRRQQIAEQQLLRQTPMDELIAARGLRAPIQVGAPQMGASQGPAPVDLAELAALGSSELQARYGGDLDRQAAALGVPVTLLASWIGRPT